ncbi:hypothetical protein BC830DRAFT_1093915 [Chytriomyces sp. MP71]|nr:hypothetical protein BC830DRAFT_1093915 [Chytriomyces sp. MP71]
MAAASLLLSLLSGVLAFDWTLTVGNQFTAFTSSIVVPPVPMTPAQGTDATYFYWPGLQTNTNSPNYLPIGNGVLQPVLTFGKACTPNQPKGASVYRGWHISAQYVNPTGTVSGYSKCLGGNMMDVQPGETLLMIISLQGTVWVQTVVRQGVACSGLGNGVDTPDGCTVSYSLDMQNQYQDRAELVLELYYSAVVTDDVFFNNIQLTVAQPEPSGSNKFCTPKSRLQKNEVCSGMQLSADGLTCSITQCHFTATASRTDTLPPPTNSTNGIDSNGNPISPVVVVAPPADNSTGLGAGSIDPPPLNTTSGGASADGAPLSPSNGGQNSNKTSSPISSNYYIYGGAGAGVLLLIVGGVVFMRRRSPAAIENAEFSEKNKALNADAKKKYEVNNQNNSSLPPRPPNSQGGSGGELSSEAPTLVPHSRDLLKPEAAASQRRSFDPRSVSHIDGSKVHVNSRQEMVDDISTCYVGSATGRSASRQQMEVGVEESTAHASGSGNARAASRQRLEGSGNGRSASRQDVAAGSGNNRSTSRQDVSGSGIGRAASRQEIVDDADELAGLSARSRSASRQDVVDNEPFAMISSADENGYLGVPSPQGRSASRQAVNEGINESQPSVNNSHRSSRIEGDNSRPSFNNRRASRIEAEEVKPSFNGRRASRVEMDEPRPSFNNRRASRIEADELKPSFNGRRASRVDAVVTVDEEEARPSVNGRRASRQMEGTGSRRASHGGGGLLAPPSAFDRRPSPNRAANESGAIELENPRASSYGVGLLDAYGDDGPASTSELASDNHRVSRAIVPASQDRVDVTSNRRLSSQPALSSNSRRASRVTDMSPSRDIEPVSVNSAISSGNSRRARSGTDRSRAMSPGESPMRNRALSPGESPARGISRDRRFGAGVDEEPSSPTTTVSGNSRQPRNDALRRNSGERYYAPVIIAAAEEERPSRSREASARRSDGRKVHANGAREVSSAGRTAKYEPGARRRDGSAGSAASSRRGRTTEASMTSRSVRDRSASSHVPLSEAVVAEEDDLC